jgi:endoglycosylceramidase
MYNERFQGEGWPDWAVQDDGLPPVPKLGFPTNYYAMPALIRAFDRFWANSRGPRGVGLQDRLAAAWRHVAARFSSERRLVGYDLLNEPWPGSAWPTCAQPLGCPPFDRGPLTTFYRRVTRRIREVDRHTVVWYEPQVLFDFGSATSQGGVGPHAGMSFHAYCLTPGPACDRTEQLPFENAERQSDRTGDALLLTEFGATDDLTEIEPVVDRADRNRLGWEYWHYCPCADPTTNGPGTTQALVVDPRRPPRGANVKAAKLAVLERPYPQAVAGTPLRFSYSRATRRFSLAYSTARPGGGSYRFRADTQVFVPRLHYRHGYDVRASGAEPISSPGAAHLRLRTCPRRRKVRVSVTPARSGRPAPVSDCRARRRKQGVPANRFEAPG